MDADKTTSYLKEVTYSVAEVVKLVGVSKTTVLKWLKWGYLTPLPEFKVLRFSPNDIILLPLRLKEVSPWKNCVKYAQNMFSNASNYYEFCRRLSVYHSLTGCPSWIDILKDNYTFTNGLSDVLPRKELTVRNYQDFDKSTAVCVNYFEQELIAFATQTNIFGIPSYHPLDALSRIYMTYIPKTRR